MKTSLYAFCIAVCVCAGQSACAQQTQPLTLTASNNAAAPMQIGGDEELAFGAFTDPVTDPRGTLSEADSADFAGSGTGVLSEPRSLLTAIGGSPRIVDTVLAEAALGNIPHVNQGPVQWSAVQLLQRPSPLTRALLRDNCSSEALWAGYEAQRARECARMWERLNRQRQCGCAPAYAVNRYTAAAGPACDSGCDSGSCTATIRQPATSVSFSSRPKRVVAPAVKKPALRKPVQAAAKRSQGVAPRYNTAEAAAAHRYH